MGCPYSIRDYTDIDPLLGEQDKFDTLVKECKKRGLGVMIDIVFNHTAHDSVIANAFPGYPHGQWDCQRCTEWHALPVATAMPCWSALRGHLQPRRS